MLTAYAVCLKTLSLISLQFSGEEAISLSLFPPLPPRETLRAAGFLSSVADELHPSLARNCISTKSAAPRGLRYYRRGFPRRSVIETRTTSCRRTPGPRLNQGNPRKKAEAELSRRGRNARPGEILALDG